VLGQPVAKVLLEVNLFCPYGLPCIYLYSSSYHSTSISRHSCIESLMPNQHKSDPDASLDMPIRDHI